MRAAALQIAVGAGLVLVVAGCAGTGKSADEKGKDAPATAPSKAATTAARVLSRQQLTQAEVGAADLTGYRVSAVGIDINVATLDRVTPAACRPIADMSSLASEYQPLAAVEQTVLPTTQGGDIAEMGLMSYKAADAPKVIADLRASVRTCSSFRFVLDDTEGFADPHLLPDPKAGDEAVAYRITNTIKDGETDIRQPYAFVVFRAGTTIAAFYTSSAPGHLTEPAPLPTELVTAQAAKLAKLPALG